MENIEIKFALSDNDFAVDKMTCRLSTVLNGKKRLKYYKLIQSKMNDEQLLNIWLKVRMNHFIKML